MAPVSGICDLFQWGKCPEPNHHKAPDGSMAIHVCQPCLQLRQNCCSGGHPGHSYLCGQKCMGAVGCPFQLQTKDGYSISNNNSVKAIQTAQHEESLKDQEVHVGYYHTPSFFCDCNHCAEFFDLLQTELDSHGLHVPLSSQWNRLHFPRAYQKYDDDDIYEDDDEDDDLGLCSDCEMYPSEFDLNLCERCIAYQEEEEYVRETYGCSLAEYERLKW